MWKVMRGKEWIGIIESNYIEAIKCWNKIGKKLNRKYWLLEIKKE